MYDHMRLGLILSDRSALWKLRVSSQIFALSICCVFLLACVWVCVLSMQAASRSRTGSRSTLSSNGSNTMRLIRRAALALVMALATRLTLTDPQPRPHPRRSLPLALAVPLAVPLALAVASATCWPYARPCAKHARRAKRPNSHCAARIRRAIGRRCRRRRALPMRPTAWSNRRRRRRHSRRRRPHLRLLRRRPVTLTVHPIAVMVERATAMPRALMAVAEAAAAAATAAVPMRTRTLTPTPRWPAWSTCPLSSAPTCSVVANSVAFAERTAARNAAAAPTPR